MRLWLTIDTAVLVIIGITGAVQPLPGQETSYPRIVLAGDSTVTDDSGWGAGFKTVFDCTNLAKSGRSSRSYRAEGWWKQCLEAKPDYLLIQFGHNDQPGKGPERESEASVDFPKHLEAFVTEARQAGIHPILVTSLERRRWSEQGTIESSLSDYVKATTDVANRLSVPLLDLNRQSIELYHRMGETAVRAMEPMSEKGADHTHLNAEGSAIIGEIVARELVLLVPELKQHAHRDVDKPQESQRADPTKRAGGLSLQETEATITIIREGVPLLVYNKTSPPVPAGIDAVYARSGFLHPVYSPAGKVITAAFPIDHAHQHGIFAAWVKTTYAGRQIDFWNLAGGTGRVLHQRVNRIFQGPVGTGFDVDLVHQTATKPVVDVLRENWKVVAYPTDGSYTCFDIETRQSALTDTPLTVEEYHYGGMALRGRVEWLHGEQPHRANGEPIQTEPNDFLNDQGSGRDQGNHQRSRWVSLYGEIEGQPACITVLSQADNFRAPQAARLHPSKPYFCFSPCVEGSFAIDREHPLLARYRYLVTDAKPDPQWIEKQWQSWTHAEQKAEQK